MIITNSKSGIRTRALAASDASLDAIEAKPLQTLLMVRASLEAQREHSPDLRPFAVSRSAAAGMQRYAQTWSGDNYTSWDTLRFNIKMGTGSSAFGDVEYRSRRGRVFWSRAGTRAIP